MSAWPFEIKVTVAIWIVAGFGALTLGWFEATKALWPPTFGVWWIFNIYVLIQFTCYRRLKRGFFAALWKIIIDPDYRRESKIVMSKPIWPPLTRHFQRREK